MVSRHFSLTRRSPTAIFTPCTTKLAIEFSRKKTSCCVKQICISSEISLRFRPYYLARNSSSLSELAGENRVSLILLCRRKVGSSYDTPATVDLVKNAGRGDTRRKSGKVSPKSVHPISVSSVRTHNFDACWSRRFPLKC